MIGMISLVYVLRIMSVLVGVLFEKSDDLADSEMTDTSAPVSISMTVETLSMSTLHCKGLGLAPLKDTFVILLSLS